MKEFPFFAVMTGLLALANPLFGQSNEVLDAFLEKPMADYDLSVYLIFSAAKLIPEGLPPEVAIETLKQKKWGYYSEDLRKEPISMGDFSYLMMKALDIKGGLLYSLFPGPWYAAKELNFRRFMTSPKKPGERLSSFEVVQAIGTVLEALK